MPLKIIILKTDLASLRFKGQMCYLNMHLYVNKHVHELKEEVPPRPSF